MSRNIKHHDALFWIDEGIAGKFSTMADSAILFRVETLRFSPPIEGHPAEWGDGSGMFMDKRKVTVTVYVAVTVLTATVYLRPLFTIIAQPGFSSPDTSPAHTSLATLIFVHYEYVWIRQSHNVRSPTLHRFFRPTPGTRTTTDGLHFAHFRQETACTILFGSVLDWNGSAWQGHGRWSVTPPKKKDTERGVLMLHLRSTVDGPAESTVMIVSDAAKSIHNMMCVLFDKQKWQVRTRAKWEIEEAAKAEKSGAS